MGNLSLVEQSLKALAETPASVLRCGRALNNMKCIFVLADKQSKEKIDNLRAFGAKVIVCPTNVEPEDPRSYYSVAKRLSETIPNSYYVNQYENHWNRDTHYNTTGLKYSTKLAGSLMYLWPVLVPAEQSLGLRCT